MNDIAIDEQVASWRSYLGEHAALQSQDLDELEDHLREQMVQLRAVGLHEDEAFLIAVKRMGSIDAVSREFGREHSERLWAQLVLGASPDQPGPDRRQLLGVLALALGAGASLVIPLHLSESAAWLARNLSLLVVPWLVGYFAWRRGIPARVLGVLALAGLAAAVVANAYPFAQPAGAPTPATEVLLAIHLPVVAWFAVGVAHASGQWRSHPARMDFVRFTGEWVIYYALIALGGAVLMALCAAAFNMLGIDVEQTLAEWIMPAGAAGAVVVAAWLVEAKKGVVENMAPVLAAVFTPLTALLLLALLVAIVAQGGLATWNSDVVVLADREILILFDLILVLVLGLLLYSLSARDPKAGPGLGDWMTMGLLVVALAVDGLMLLAMVGRISEYGASPNKVVALGLNLLLLVNLAWAARLWLAFMRGRSPLARIVSWQMSYLTVFAIWSAIVVVVVPVVFGFR